VGVCMWRGCRGVLGVVIGGLSSKGIKRISENYRK